MSVSFFSCPHSVMCMFPRCLHFSLMIATEYEEGFKLKGWQGQPDQSDAVMHAGQATFHPTKCVVGTLNFLKQQPNFTCYTNT